MKDESVNFKSIWYNTKDNVATALSLFPKGETITVKSQGHTIEVLLKNDIPEGHKFSLTEIPKGSDIIKYSESIGIAISNINAGMHVHVHNLESCRARGDLKRR